MGLPSPGLQIAGLAVILSLGAGPVAGTPLPWSDLNIMVVTDVHSWVSGHPHAGEYSVPRDADYGDLVSFYEHVRGRAAAAGRDLFLVNDGDIVDGTGASYPYGRDVVQLVGGALPFDLINTGNHELYKDEVLANVVNKTIGLPATHPRAYVTSNVAHAGSRRNLGRNFTYLFGNATGSKYVGFGFLYNMQNHCDSAVVRTVESVIGQSWFASALRNGTRGAIILAHMDLVDPLVFAIRDKIRTLMGDRYPVVFLTGHTHYRGFSRLDNFSVSFEAGKYLDTIGFLGASLPQNHSAIDDGFLNMTVTPMYITTNRAHMAAALGIPTRELPTPGGVQTQSAIQALRRRLGLDTVLGCSPYGEPVGASSARIWTQFIEHVLPATLPGFASSNTFAIFSGGFRYSLYPGQITADDVYKLSPFKNQFVVFPDVTGAVISTALVQNQNFSDYFRSEFIPNDTTKYTVVTMDFGAGAIGAALVAQGYAGSPSAQPYPSTFLDSTTIWYEYVQRHWECETGGSDNNTTYEIQPGVLAAVIIVLMLIGASIPVGIYCFAPCVNGHMPLEDEEQEGSKSVEGVLGQQLETFAGDDEIEGAQVVRDAETGSDQDVKVCSPRSTDRLGGHESSGDLVEVDLEGSDAAVGPGRAQVVGNPDPDRALVL